MQNLDRNGATFFDNIAVLTFCVFSFKMPIHISFWCIWRIWPPKWGGISMKPPKGTSLHRRHHMMHRLSKLAVTCTSDEETENTKTSKSQTACSARQPCRRIKIKIKGSSLFQVSSKSVKWFMKCNWSKSTLSHCFCHWLIQQHLLLYKPWQ